MLLDRNKYNEAAYIGEELFGDPLKERLHKCMVVEGTIADGDFSMDEALEAYQISREEYENYVAEKSNANIFNSISGSVANNPALRVTYATPVYIDVFVKMIESSFDDKMHSLFDDNLIRIKEELQQISKGIEELKEKA